MHHGRDLEVSPSCEAVLYDLGGQMMRVARYRRQSLRVETLRENLDAPYSPNVPAKVSLSTRLMPSAFGQRPMTNGC